MSIQYQPLSGQLLDDSNFPDKIKKNDKGSASQ